MLELLLQGVQVRSGGVWGVWAATGSRRSPSRLVRREETAKKRKLKLSGEQIRALERFDLEFRDRQIEVHFPGDLAVSTGDLAGTLESPRWAPATTVVAATHWGPDTEPNAIVTLEMDGAITDRVINLDKPEVPVMDVWAPEESSFVFTRRSQPLGGILTPLDAASEEGPRPGRRRRHIGRSQRRYRTA